MPMFIRHRCNIQPEMALSQSSISVNTHKLCECREVQSFCLLFLAVWIYYHFFLLFFSFNSIFDFFSPLFYTFLFLCFRLYVVPGIFLIKVNGSVSNYTLSYLSFLTYLYRLYIFFYFIFFPLLCPLRLFLTISFIPQNLF